jgi:hypothetical protein
MFGGGLPQHARRGKGVASRFAALAHSAQGFVVLRHRSMAGSQFPAPIVLHEHTQDQIRWRVSIHPEIDRGPGITAVRFLKHGKRSKLLDQIGEWSPQGWRSAPGPRVPKVLIERIERELEHRNRPRPKAGLHRCQVGQVAQGISGGGMSFQAFLQMELAEAWLPQWRPQLTNVPGR